MLDCDSLIHVLKYLTVRDRHQCRQVCHRWKSASDHLNISEKMLKIISGSCKYKNYQESSNIIIWPRVYIKYTSFCDLMKQFPNLTSLSIIGINQWCDPMMDILVKSCEKLVNIEFISCSGLGNNKLTIIIIIIS